MPIPNEVFQRSLLKHLSPVAEYMSHPDVSEILVNGPDQVFIEQGGRLIHTNAKFDNTAKLLAAIRAAAQFCGKHVDDREPIFEGRLPDGSRIQGVIGSIATGGPYLSIRRFFQTRLSLEQLVASKALSPLAARALQVFVAGKMNIMISGGTGSGKTSLLNVLTSSIPDGERIGVIEDSREVQVQKEHVFQLEARRAEPEAGLGAITIRDLFQASLRLRPDRIIIGEIRGGEALDIIQAMVSGHGGCMGTLHATTPTDALVRLETMAMMSDVKMPLSAVRAQIASGVNIIIQIDRRSDGRRVVSAITEVLGFDESRNRYDTRPIFERHFDASDPNDDGAGLLMFSGNTPACDKHLRSHGYELPFELRANP